MKYAFILPLVLLTGCHSVKQVEPPKPYWIGDRAYIGGKNCGSVTRMNGHLTMYNYVISKRFMYEIVSGGGESPANEYVDKILKGEVENYCATQFYYYGQDGDDIRPQDKERSITIWDDITHSKFGGRP